MFPSPSHSTPDNKAHICTVILLPEFQKSTARRRAVPAKILPFKPKTLAATFPIKPKGQGGVSPIPPILISGDLRDELVALLFQRLWLNPVCYANYLDLEE